MRPKLQRQTFPAECGCIVCALIGGIELGRATSRPCERPDCTVKGQRYCSCTSDVWMATVKGACEKTSCAMPLPRFLFDFWVIFNGALFNIHDEIIRIIIKSPRARWLCFLGTSFYYKALLCFRCVHCNIGSRYYTFRAKSRAKAIFGDICSVNCLFLTQKC